MISWTEIPWNAVIWLVFSGVIIFGVNQFEEKLTGNDPEGYQVRKKQLTIYAYVISALSIIQIVVRTELNPVFSYGVTAMLFFWMMKTEKEVAKRKAARNMGILIAVLAFLAFLGGF
ncbi:hypothetical protein SDC9_175973 [bioreactor metagenome]|uniref:DUF4181 domain-containing protein n=1 Tax=bioreactor metagenome TaxID=1076179 RepID=A0A645GNN1_9ZZZZ